jgi:hypothetical protein
MQFVAAQVGSDYSVEAQLTNQDSVAGIQFEIMVPKILVKKSKGFQIVVFQSRGKFPQSFKVNGLEKEDRISTLKSIIAGKTGLNPNMFRLHFDGRRMSEGTFSIYGPSDACY